MLQVTIQLLYTFTEIVQKEFNAFLHNFLVSMIHLLFITPKLQITVPRTVSKQTSCDPGSNKGCCNPQPPFCCYMLTGFVFSLSSHLVTVDWFISFCFLRLAPKQIPNCVKAMIHYIALIDAFYIILLLSIWTSGASFVFKIIDSVHGIIVYIEPMV